MNVIRKAIALSVMGILVALTAPIYEDHESDRAGSALVDQRINEDHEANGTTALVMDNRPFYDDHESDRSGIS